MIKTIIKLLVYLLVFSISPLAIATEKKEQECEGPYKDKKLTPQEISNIVESHYLYLLENHSREEELELYDKKHQKWLKSRSDSKLPLPLKGLTAKFANLCGAVLIGTNLQEAILIRANLQKANLSVTNLQKANLSETNLQEAILIRANLQKAYLGIANLQKAYLKNANLQEAILTRANLQKAILSETNLQEAKLYRAYLQEAVLSSANLQKAYLGNANLQKAYLKNANLQEANLYSANLEEANLSAANIAKANLKRAKLVRARLVEVELEGANFINADISDSIFTPVSVPNGGLLTNLKGLLTVKLEIPRKTTFKIGDSSHNVSGLVLLRNSLKESGLRDLERQATFKIEQWKTDNAAFAEKWLKKIFFEYTTGYGLYYGRPLKIILVLMILFTFIYLAPIASKPKEESGIFRIWPKDEQEENITETKDIKIIGYAFYFSLLSAFYIGWRELNVGSWISRLQPKAYTLQAKGWVRTMSGIQSLISVYLLAMWALTYFGRPFE